MLLSLLCALAAFAAGTLAWRGRGRWWLLLAGPCAGLALALALFAAGVRTGHLGLRSRLLHVKGVAEDPLRPTAVADEAQVSCFDSAGVRACVNGRGMRVTPPPPHPQSPGALFLGDSFTRGDGVADAETLPAQLQARGHFRAANAGVSGGSTATVYRLLTAAPHLLPAGDFRAGIYTFLGQHLLRNRGAGALRFDPILPAYELTSRGELRFRGSFERARLGWLWKGLLGEAELGYLLQVDHGMAGGFLVAGEASEEDRRLTRALLLGARDAFGARYPGGTFAVNVWPGSRFPGDEEFWRELARELPVLRMTGELELRPQNGHPSPASYARMADFLDLELLRLLGAGGAKRERP